MAQDTLHARPDVGRTFTTAMWLIGLLAAAQVTAVGWAVATRPIQPDPAPGAANESTLPKPNGGGLPAPSSNPKAATPVAIATSGDAQQFTDFPNNALTGKDNPDSQFTALPPMPILIDPDQAPSPNGSSEKPPAPPNPAPSNPSPIATGPAPSNLSPLPAPGFTGPDSPPPLSTALTEAALQSPASIAIPDPKVGQMVDAGAEKRASGNMQGALDDLRQAEAILPDHPRILSEIAATYSEMGLDRKASLYWERVRDLGAASAGAWHSIATGELTGQPGAPNRIPPILRLGRVTAGHDQTITEGERVVLSVSVEADPKARPSASEMEMLVYFYDLVDEEETEASTADTSQNFISEPYNWLANGKETIEVIYHQPVFTPEQTRELGRRKYYGYIIELYYRDELQDVAAFPPDLANLDPNSAPSSLADPPVGPDNSLFPSVPTNDE